MSQAQKRLSITQMYTIICTLIIFIQFLGLNTFENGNLTFLKCEYINILWEMEKMNEAKHNEKMCIKERNNGKQIMKWKR